MADSQPSSSTSSPLPADASPQEPKRGPHRYKIYANSLPHMQILIPKNPKLPLGIETDQRCLTYCSQSVWGRAHGNEPWCRTICLRKVFFHEVRGTLLKNGQEVNLNMRLPPEGLKGVRMAKTLFTTTPDKEKIARESNPLWNPISSTNATEPEDELWKAGWYLYLSKRLVPGLEQLSSMERTLPSNNLIRALRGKFLVFDRDKDYKAFDEEFPQLTKQIVADTVRLIDTTGTILIPLSPPVPSLVESMGKLLAPTMKVLKLTQESIASGRQLELAGRLWEKAQTRDPFILASTVVQRAWKTLRNQDNDDDDDGSGSKQP